MGLAALVVLVKSSKSPTPPHRRYESIEKDEYLAATIDLGTALQSPIFLYKILATCLFFYYFFVPLHGIINCVVLGSYLVLSSSSS